MLKLKVLLRMSSEYFNDIYKCKMLCFLSMWYVKTNKTKSFRILNTITLLVNLLQMEKTRLCWKVRDKNRYLILNHVGLDYQPIPIGELSRYNTALIAVPRVYIIAPNKARLKSFSITLAFIAFKVCVVMEPL